MRFYLDTEFDGYGGRLISLALVPYHGHDHLYLLDPVNAMEAKDAWVRQNVVPAATRGDPGDLPTVTEADRFGFHVSNYLAATNGTHTIVADWFEDIARLNVCLMSGPGKAWINAPKSLGMFVMRGDNKPGEIPHNALSDARALRDFWEPATLRIPTGGQ
jgi:hypothetical protein